MKNKKAKLVTPEHLHSIRHWERENLPHYGKEAGYLLFLELAKGNANDLEVLKKFYLSMPYAESTIRLLIRNLEIDGWVQMPRKDSDKRFRQFNVTDKFEKVKHDWLLEVESTLIPNILK